MTISIRPAVKEDAATILSFINELAIYEKEPDAVINSVEQIEEKLFGQDVRAHGVICEYQGHPVGFAVYFFNYSTWVGKYGLYLEDLYVAEQHRGIGAGKALMRHLAQLAVEKDCGRFEWTVLDWNQKSIEFYDSIGAKPQNEWIIYRMDGERLKQFAENG